MFEIAVGISLVPAIQSQRVAQIAMKSKMQKKNMYKNFYDQQ
jgi:hypothetical protein